MSSILRRVRSAFSFNSTDLIPPSKNSSSSTGRTGNDSLFLDAIYEHPTNHAFRNRSRPFGSSRSALKKLGKLIEKKLSGDGSQVMAAPKLTGFTAIQRDQGGLYRLNATNHQELTRTKAEMELHILLQSQVRYASAYVNGGAQTVDFGDSVTMTEARAGRDSSMSRQAAQASTRQPAPSAPPSPAATVVNAPGSAAATATGRAASGNPFPSPDPAFRARFEEDQQGNRIHNFTSETIDMETVDRMLMSTSHIVKGISGANGNCWLRSGWLNALVTHKNRSAGQELEALLREKLGPEYDDDARKVREMAGAFHRDGIQTVVTGMEFANKRADFETESYLKLPAEDSLCSGADSEGEAVCTRLTGALLRRAGVSEEDLDKYIVQSNFGEHWLLNTLLRELDCDSIVYGRQVEWNDASASAVFRPDWSLLAISARPDSRLENLPIFPGQSCTDALLNELDTPPVQLHKGAHFNLCIAHTSLLGTGNFRWPT